MSRLLASIVLCVSIWVCPDMVGVQAAGGATAREAELLADQSPTIAEANRVDPENGPSYKDRLRFIFMGNTHEQSKGLGPTTGEANQIVADKAFSMAYDLDPIRTLRLLRDVNEDLAKKRVRASSRAN